MSLLHPRSELRIENRSVERPSSSIERNREDAALTHEMIGSPIMKQPVADLPVKLGIHHRRGDRIRTDQADSILVQFGRLCTRQASAWAKRWASATWRAKYAKEVTTATAPIIWPRALTAFQSKLYPSSLCAWATRAIATVSRAFRVTINRYATRRTRRRRAHALECVVTRSTMPRSRCSWVGVVPREDQFVSAITISDVPDLQLSTALHDARQ